MRNDWISHVGEDGGGGDREGGGRTERLETAAVPFPLPLSVSYALSLSVPVAVGPYRPIQEVGGSAGEAADTVSQSYLNPEPMLVI